MGSEEKLAQDQKAWRGADVWLMRQTGFYSMCYFFHGTANAQRKKLANSLTEPSAKVLHLARTFLPLLGNGALLVHWRSVTDPVMNTLMAKSTGRRIPPMDQKSHHQKCAKALLHGVDQLRDANRNGKRRVVLFSDIHAGYREFNPYWRK